jgi:nitrate reductase gamma subunit
MNTVLFVGIPYIALFLAIVVGFYRFAVDRYSYSSFSSQFLESKTLFWGVVPWHYGIVTILTVHLFAFLFPGVWAMFTADPMRLAVIEVVGLALAAMSIIGLVVLFIRRASDARASVVTTTMDWLLLIALLIQVVMGFWVAFVYRWGSDWYLNTAAPWMLSLLTLSPKIDVVSVLPWQVQLHLLWGFVLLGLFPFTRLVHIAGWPIAYLVSRPSLQVVIWNRDRKSQYHQQL